jgi:hypothetical protein
MKKTEKTQGANPSDSEKSLLGQVAEEVKQDLKVTPQGVTDAIVKDAKQAVNYEIRRGFRSLINGFFKGR